MREETKKRLYLEFLERFDRGEALGGADWLEYFFLSGLEKGLDIARKGPRLGPLWLAKEIAQSGLPIGDSGLASSKPAENLASYKPRRKLTL